MSRDPTRATEQASWLFFIQLFMGAFIVALGTHLNPYMIMAGFFFMVSSPYYIVYSIRKQEKQETTSC